MVAQQEAPDQGGVRARLGRAQEEGASLEAGAAGQMAATYAFGANVQVLRIESRMKGALLDEKV